MVQATEVESTLVAADSTPGTDSTASYLSSGTEPGMVLRQRTRICWQKFLAEVALVEVGVGDFDGFHVYGDELKHYQYYP